MGYSNLIQTAKYNKNIFNKSIDYIYNESIRLQSLCTKMMDLIYYKNNDTICKKCENLKEFFEEIFVIMNPKLNQKNINLIYKVNKIDAFIDKDLFKILITNLLDNAIKASFNNSEIYLKGYVNEKAKLTIEIIDKGVGIKEEDIDKIFEPFYMVDKSRDYSNYNIGLGLPLCIEIAKLHDIEINIKSKINKGTIVQLIFN
jgi:K+-sensing histidine kinase KdpD